MDTLVHRLSCSNLTRFCSSIYTVYNSLHPVAMDKLFVEVFTEYALAIACLLLRFYARWWTVSFRGFDLGDAFAGAATVCQSILGEPYFNANSSTKYTCTDLLLFRNRWDIPALYGRTGSTPRPLSLFLPTGLMRHSIVWKQCWPGQEDSPRGTR
jgi:hypothetical protein